MRLFKTYLIINLVRTIILGLASYLAFNLNNPVLSAISVACLGTAFVYLMIETLTGVSERVAWFCFIPTTLDILTTNIFLYFTGTTSFMVGAYIYTTAICALNTKVPQGMFSVVFSALGQLLVIMLVLSKALPYENVFDPQSSINYLSMAMCLIITQIVNFAVLGIVHNLMTRNQSLMIEVSRQKDLADELLHNTLPRTVVAELKSNNSYAPKLLRQSAVVFTDFVNFTSTVNGHAPHDILANLDSYFCAFDDILEKHDLERLKTIGDGYMFFSGLDSDPQKIISACLAAVEINQYVSQRLSAPDNLFSFNIRVGIACGEVIGGIIGTKRFAFDIWGSTVNLASRLESATFPGTILISAELAAIVAPHFHLRACKPVSLKGFQAQKVYLLGQPKALAVTNNTGALTNSLDPMTS